MSGPDPLDLDALDVVSDALIALDRDLRYVHVNRSAERLLGFTRDEILGRGLAEVFPGEAEGDFARAARRAMDQGTVQQLVEHVAAIGRWLETRVFPTADGVAAIVHDITERREAERELALREQRYRVLAHAMSSVVWRADAAGVAQPSESWSSLTGRGNRISSDIDWERAVHVDDRERVGAAWEHSVQTGDEFDELYRVRVADGAWRHVRARGVPVVAEGRIQEWIGVIDDVTEQLAAEAMLRSAAYEDPLTGLPNRQALLERLAAIGRRRGEGPGALLYVDVDRFKAVNDSGGHAAGDDLLRAVADRLRAAVRPSDVVSRLSGDEFAVLCDALDDADEALAIARRVCRAVRAVQDPVGRPVTAAVGVALITDPQVDPEAALRAADDAMYAVKARGGDGVEVHDAALRERLRRRTEVERDLREGLETDGLRLHFQPIVRVDGDVSVPVVEALLRWRARDGSTLPAAEAVEVAERSGLIVAIGREVLRTACRQAAVWNAARDTPLAVAVNVSARQVARGDELVADVAAALEVSGLEPALLGLEITESVLMESMASGRSVLERLRALGVGLAIDDFGVGYSSLSYLHRLPVDAVKIDRSFVGRLPGDAGSARIVEAVVGIARAFGADVTAEGIERRDQLDAIRGLGCTAAQGYLLARPAPVEELPAAVAAAARTASA